MSIESGGRAHRDCPTYKILECVIPSEYNALSDNNKEKLKILLSCGEIDTRVGNDLRASLEAIFPEGTATRTKLDAMFYQAPPVVVP